MTIHRFGDKVPFAQIPNATLRDSRLSFKARGILAMVLSHSEGWQATAHFIEQQSDEDGRRAVQSGLDELTKYGYRQVEYVRNAGKGQVETIVTWYHTPPVRFAHDHGLCDPQNCTFCDQHKTCPAQNVTSTKPVGPIEHHSSEHHVENTSQELLVGTPLSLVRDDEPEESPTRIEARRLAGVFSAELTKAEVKHRVNEKWIKDLDYMLRLDKRTPQEIEGAIRWAMAHHFWCSIIHSPANLRKNFDKMRKQAGQPQTKDDRSQAVLNKYLYGPEGQQA